MEKPVCLIENTSAGELRVNQEALEILNSIKQPVVVVSIVGMYRTGKSYLMNRLAGKQTGFPLGSTVQSETKGIWMWCVPHPHRDNQTLVLLDSEGLGDVAKGDQAHDTWIFSLAVLLSCTFVYNSMGTINNEAVMSLHYVTELTEHIKVKSGKEEEGDTAAKYIHFFPTFVWAVRDFTLELRIDGQTVTADEYLDNSLKLVKGKSRQAAYSNGPRECIRNYFPTRKCFVFDQPASKEKLRIIDKLTDADLDPAFVQQTLDFCSYIFKQSREKTITGGYTVTGQMLGNLAVTYVDAIRSGSVPCLENAVAALSQIENSAAVEESFALYRRLLGERVKLHTETQEELSTVQDVCLKEALQLFMKRSFKDEDQSYQKGLMERIRDEYDGKCSENAVLSQTHCIALLQQLWNNLDHDSFMKPGGYADYRVQLDSIIQTYRATPGKGVQAEQALEIFMKEKNDVGSSILNADRNLSEQERKLQEEEARAEMERFKAEVARREQEDTEKRLEDAQRAHRENEKQLMERMEKERHAILEENQRVLDRRLQEQRALISEGFEQKSRMMEAQIDSLQKEVAASKNRGGGGGCILL
ncbi:guanylate-binding protein 1-like [Conger conger]|uniref:guanylate-binding protein 1-like n=1 Tax=Conger conger TaxID=82655 RepID=UPI002A5A3EFC|nr:guanylate-binding protein 1-like [Conger conger]XP_061102698.1 guanylate-binding protein 1-like [Conger conger]